METKGFFNLKSSKMYLTSPFCSFEYLCYGSTVITNNFSAESYFRRQNLTSIDVRFWRLSKSNVGPRAARVNGLAGKQMGKNNLLVSIVSRTLIHLSCLFGWSLSRQATNSAHPAGNSSWKGDIPGPCLGDLDHAGSPFVDAAAFRICQEKREGGNCLVIK